MVRLMRKPEEIREAGADAKSGAVEEERFVSLQIDAQIFLFQCSDSQSTRKCAKGGYLGGYLVYTDNLIHLSRIFLTRVDCESEH
jgi:hypothetical protein